MKHYQYAQMKVKNGGTVYVNTQYVTAYGYAEARDETIVAVLGEKDPIYFPGDQTEEIRKSINYGSD